MSSAEVWTWGTGASYGREFGMDKAQRAARQRRGHAAASLIAGDTHILVDAGAQCSETMIDNDIGAPDLLFVTHGHDDHAEGIGQLAHCRQRSSLLASRHLPDPPSPPPLNVIGTDPCLRHDLFGVAERFSSLDSSIVRWLSVPDLDTWYIVDPAATHLTPAPIVRDPAAELFLDFKALPVPHTDHSPGSCLYVFRFPNARRRGRRVAFTGDFKSLPDNVLHNPDLAAADLVVMETNTLETQARGHSTWLQNTEILRTWYAGTKKQATILLTHISGYEDCRDGPYIDVPDDAVWEETVRATDLPEGLTVEIAKDGACYPVP